MKRFNIEGLDYAGAKARITENLQGLFASFNEGDMKAGRYISLYYLMEAAERGDITSQIALASLYEFGNIVEQDIPEAKHWYEKAIEQDHPRQDGSMLAENASRAMERLG